MSEPSASARPRQVTMAAWLTMVGSALVVLLVFDRVAGLHTLETRQSVERFLAEPPASDLGLGVDGVLSIVRTLSLVAGGCAAAAAILGFHVLKRSRSARLALTILAVPLFLSGMVTGGFVSSLVAASSVMLWLRPARDWFRDAPAQGLDGATRRPEPEPALAPGTTPAPIQQPAIAVPARRPPAVTWACILTWAGSGVTALGVVASGVVLGLQPDVLLEEVRRQNPDLESQGVSDGLLIGVTFAMLGGFVVWALAAATVALFVLRGQEWARVTLLVSAATAAAIFLLGTVVGAFVLALALATSVMTVVLLVRPEVRAWFRAPSA
ncbi:hypothetical protein [Nocardioides hungaricus]